MTTTFLNQGNDDPLQDEAFVAQLINTLIRMQHAMEENKQLKQRVEALETENAALDGEAQPARLQGQVHHHYASSRRHAQAELPLERYAFGVYIELHKALEGLIEK